VTLVSALSNVPEDPAECKSAYGDEEEGHKGGREVEVGEEVCSKSYSPDEHCAENEEAQGTNSWRVSFGRKKVPRHKIGGYDQCSHDKAAACPENWARKEMPDRSDKEKGPEGVDSEPNNRETQSSPTDEAPAPSLG